MSLQKKTIDVYYLELDIGEVRLVNIYEPDSLPGDHLPLVPSLLAGQILQVLALQQPVLLHAAGHLPRQHSDALSDGEQLELATMQCNG